MNFQKLENYSTLWSVSNSTLSLGYETRCSRSLRASMFGHGSLWSLWSTKLKGLEFGAWKHCRHGPQVLPDTVRTNWREINKLSAFLRPIKFWIKFWDLLHNLVVDIMSFTDNIDNLEGGVRLRLDTDQKVWQISPPMPHLVLIWNFSTGKFSSLPTHNSNFP
jgi:hypothetical protein